MVSKKIIIGVVAVLAIAGAYYGLSGNSKLMTGRLTFFKEAPTSSQAVEASFGHYRDAVGDLVTLAVKKGRLGAAQEKEWRDYVAAIPETSQLTRGEFANVAVKILGLTTYGSGPVLSDLSGNARKDSSIYLFVSNGGLTEEFKPNNPATELFVQNALRNFEQSVR